MTRRSRTRRCPVVDFDLTEHAHAPGFRRCPATRCGRPGARWCGPRTTAGHWIVSTYDLVAAAFRDWETFSSERRDPGRSAIAFTNSSLPPCLPEESDPPHWYGYRRALAHDPLAAGLGATARPRPPLDAARARPGGRRRARSSSCTTSPARCPASVTLEWLGYPQDEWQWFSDTFHGISAYPAGSPEHHEASKAYGPVLARINEELRDRIASPRDDALTAIAHHEVDGERLPEDIAQSIAFLTTVGGIDTTTALAGGALLHLSQFPADRRRLIDEPELLPLATEEFLRFYPAGPRPQAHRRGRHRVRRRHHEAGRRGAAERGGRRSRLGGVPRRRHAS